METVDKIYELINQDNSINTFKNNQDLFREFVFHYMNIHFFGYKVISIYKYLLEYKPKFDDFDFDYTGDIFYDINFYEQAVTQSVYTAGKEIGNENVDALYAFIEMYNYFKNYDENNRLINENKFIRDYTGSMIIILNKAFFNLSIDNIKKMIDSVENNDYIKEIVNKGTNGKELLDKDYIYQYVSRFLFTKEFTNQECIKNDILLKALLNGQITDKELIKRILKDVNLDLFFEVFNNSFSEYIDMLESTFEDEVVQKELFNLLAQRIRKEDIDGYLLEFIIEDERYKKYLTEEEKQDIIKVVADKYPTTLNDEQILYLADNYSQMYFYCNIYENLKDCTWSEETIKKLKEKLNNYDEKSLALDLNLKSSINYLDKGFKGQEFNIYVLFAAVKRLIKEYLHDESIKVYMIASKNLGGCAIHTDNSIKIDISGLSKLRNCSNIEDNPASLDVLDTLFHEARHIMQFRTMDNSDMPDDVYKQYKETILRNSSSNYYSKNYYGVSFEQEARAVGAFETANLLKVYFSYMEKSIKFYEDLGKEEMEKEYPDREIFELSNSVSIDEALDRLIAINRNILIENKNLSREYKEDGTKKEISTQK